MVKGEEETWKKQEETVYRTRRVNLVLLLYMVIGIIKVIYLTGASICPIRVTSLSLFEVTFLVFVLRWSLDTSQLIQRMHGGR